MQGLNVTATHIRGTSWLHRLNPISKLAWVLAVVFFSFASYNPFPLFAIALLGLLMGFTAGISKPLMRILLVFRPTDRIGNSHPDSCSRNLLKHLHYGGTIRAIHPLPAGYVPRSVTRLTCSGDGDYYARSVDDHPSI